MTRWEEVSVELEHFISLADVGKTYGSGSSAVHAVKQVSFQVDRGEFCVIVGPSGAGKTTVLNILGGMDSPGDGQVIVNGQDIATFTAAELTAYRRQVIGFVFQFYNLVPNLTALENVELATRLCPDAFDPAEILAAVGLEKRLQNFPAQLSGGEQQRVAIARALAKNPQLLLCDEPTGALDQETGRQVLVLLQQMCRETGCTVIVITHNRAIIPIADRVIEIRDGTVTKAYSNEHPLSAEAIEW